MAEIKDYPCSYGTKEDSIVSLVQKCGLAIPDVYRNGADMVTLARAVKAELNDKVVYLPFDHVVEAEALGASVNYGSAQVGPRSNGYVCTRLEEISALPDLDVTKGRMAEVLQACRILADEGETVILEVVGPVTVLNSLIDLKEVFKGMRRKPDLMNQIFDKIERNLQTYIKAAVDTGVKIISYGDAVATVTIMGPKILTDYTVNRVAPFLKVLEATVEHKALFLLCPKTAFALTGTETGIYEPLGVTDRSTLTYEDGWLYAVGKAGFVGQMCIKNAKSTVNANKILKITLQ